MFLDFDIDLKGVELGVTKILQASTPARQEDIDEISSNIEEQIKATTASVYDYLLPLEF